MYVTLGAVLQSLVILLCFLVSFQSARIPLGAGACDSFFSATCLLMRPSQALFFLSVFLYQFAVLLAGFSFVQPALSARASCILIIAVFSSWWDHSSIPAMSI